MFRVRDKIAQLPLSTIFDHFGGIILSTLSKKVGQVSVCPIRSFTGVVVKYQFVKSFAVIRCVLYVSGARQMFQRSLDDGFVFWQNDRFRFGCVFDLESFYLLWVFCCHRNEFWISIVFVWPCLLAPSSLLGWQWMSANHAFKIYRLYGFLL